MSFLLTRLVEIANPDWRFIGWALALEAIALSLLALHWLGGRPAVKHFGFPILFFLVAVPWPTFVEQPIVQWLTRGIITATVELLNALGFAALPHGNVIETAGGFVDVDEACSGIRSLQAALMLALFFGEWRRLNVTRRMVLLGAAFVLACVFNLGRTLTLSLVAAKQGSDAVASWHDPAGITILVGCFVGVWAVATWLAKKQEDASQGQRTQTDMQRSEVSPVVPAFRPSFPQMRPAMVLALVLLLLAGEFAVRFWYATAPRVTTPDWSAEFPRTMAAFKPVTLPPAALKMLRYDEGESASWQNSDGTRWQMIYLRWHPGRVAATVARTHTPEVCLPAAGRNLRSISDVAAVQGTGLSMPFRCYVTEQNGRPLFVFYSLWEDGAREQRITTELLTWRARFDAVRERRSNRGQRVIQIGLWGARDIAHAEQLLRTEFPRLVQLTPKP